MLLKRPFLYFSEKIRGGHIQLQRCDRHIPAFDRSEIAIIVTLPSSGFRAVYYKPHGQPQLILRERTKTDDYYLLSEAWKAASDKARELVWIV